MSERAREMSPSPGPGECWPGTLYMRSRKWSRISSLIRECAHPIFFFFFFFDGNPIFFFESFC